ncbi:MAG: vanadium-dependent haloperoxidase [Planctomycetota bacterium]
MRASTLFVAATVSMTAGLAAAAPIAARLDAARLSQTQTQQAEPAKAQAHRMAVQTHRPSELVDLASPRGESHTVARLWNEMLLFSIRNDFARPTVHARNLFHISAGMYDAWSAFEAVADQVFVEDRIDTDGLADMEAQRDKAIAYAAYRLIQHRFQFSPGALDIFPEADALMDALGYDKFFFSQDGDGGNEGAALGNRIAQHIIAFGLQDGSNEQNDYGNSYYAPINVPLIMDFPGNPDMVFPNRWQPLSLEFFIDQSGNPIPGNVIPFLSPEWGNVEGFALREMDRTVLQRDGATWNVWHDPGAPPYINEAGDRFKRGMEMVAVWSSHLDPSTGVMIDVSPRNVGNAVLPTVAQEDDYYNFFGGGDWATGRDINPVTGEPYQEQIVPLGDYGRILAEFWADGPDSETPPGHWFTILNYVTDHPLFERRWKGEGPIVDALEWDIKSYLAMGGAMHDIAISSWSVKGYYDYVRPVSAIRYMCDRGQCTDPNMPNFDPEGINLIPGFIEQVNATTTAAGGKHEHLAGEEGKIALLAWRGPDYIQDPETDVAGVDWILAEEWWPYQRPSFVTPPFAGYVSGHSTYSRGAAELMTLLTGDEYFPGGVGEFEAPQNEFLVFEDGPSMDITLQWATYRDASDQCSLSRIWGGIHPPADDIPGRHMGLVIGPDSFFEAERYFNGQKSCPADFTADANVTADDVTAYISTFLSGDLTADLAAPFRTLNFFDVAEYLNQYLAGCP